MFCFFSFLLYFGFIFPLAFLCVSIYVYDLRKCRGSTHSNLLSSSFFHLLFPFIFRTHHFDRYWRCCSSGSRFCHNRVFWYIVRRKTFLVFLVFLLLPSSKLPKYWGCLIWAIFMQYFCDEWCYLNGVLLTAIAQSNCWFIYVHQEWLRNGIL